MSNPFIVNQYVDQASKIVEILTRDTDISEEEMKEFLTEKATENLLRTPCELVNNYTNKRSKTDMVKLLDWYNKKNPIPCEHGCFFKNHEEAINLNAAFVNSFLTERKRFKKLMFQAEREGNDEQVAFYNINQKVQKIFANSYYGAQGQHSSIFYNLYTALSITGKGQSIISCAATTFEMFLCNSIKFRNSDECLHFIANVVNEENSFNCDDWLDRNITRKELLARLANNFNNKIDFTNNQDVIKGVIVKLTQDEINRIYYKNNLYDFSINEKVFKIIDDIVITAKQFRNPNEVPEEIEEMINHYWDLLKEFVYYNYPVYDRVNWLKTETRSTIITVDTDSNFINLEPYYEFVMANTKNNLDREDLDTTYKIVNLISFILGKVIAESYWTFTTNCNVPEDKRTIINMKNEFFLSRILLTGNKKNYASRVLLQEGVELPPHKQLDIKGLAIKKSNVNKNTSAFLQNLLRYDILQSEIINTKNVLQELSKFEETVYNTFTNGDITYMTPTKVNEIESYKAPLTQAAVRASIVYNLLYPENSITYPAQINMIKVKMKELADITPLYETEPEIYRTLKEKVYEDEDLKKYGITYFALPKSLDKIPDWLIPYIDIEEIIKDNLNNFLVILESIGLKTIKVTADDLYHSNIIEF